MHQLIGRVQHYSWGGDIYIPRLLSLQNPEKQPFAEYWLGVHPGGISEVLLGQHAFTTLSALINSDKKRYLGVEVLSAFGTLPYLFKVLDVRDMLSIQVHPSRSAAEQGYNRENEAGIPLDAPNRNYKDKNHKPEVMVALSDDFWLLHGFRPDLSETLSNYPFLAPFKAVFDQSGIKDLYTLLMELSQEEVDRIIDPYAKEILPKYMKSEINRSSPDFWAARMISKMDKEAQHYDRGIFSIYLLNIVHLQRGEGIFQGAGMPHAYLEGQNIELMSNSDNVLRAGLTNKYVDIPELINNTNFVPTYPKIIQADLNKKLQEYRCPVPDFTLFSSTLKAGEKQSFNRGLPRILFVVSGRGQCLEDISMQISYGNAFFIGAEENITITTEQGLSFFMASVLGL
jgi:mannose-6-phosphate isomerase